MPPMTALASLIGNFSFVFILMLAFAYIEGLIARTQRARLLMIGIAMGLIAVVAMLTSVEIAHGVFVDSRLVVITITTIFVHPLSGALAALITILGRLLIGGAGAWAGVITVVMAYGVGYAYYRYVAGDVLRAPRWLWLTLGGALLIGQAPAILAVPTSAQSAIANIALAYGLFHLILLPFLAFISLETLRQRSAQSALMEREYFIERIADTTPNLLYLYDLRSQRYIYASKEITSILGYTPEELHKLPDGGILDLIHPDDLPAALKRQKEEVLQLKDNEVSEGSFRMRHRDGTWHWLTVREVIFSRDEQGRPTQIMGVALDTTRQKIDEERLRYQANLLDNVSDAIISIDNNYHITTWNRAAERIYGWTEQEVIGRHINEVVQPQYPNQTPEAVLAEFIANGYWEGEASQIRKDGARRIIYARTTALYDPNGTRIGAVSINRDITDLKQANLRQLEMAVQKEKIAFLRQFISDASHDFRTPLATIHTSLYLLARADDPQQRQRHIERITWQTQHIQKLVEDMLTLVRMDADGITLFEAVDLSQLVNDLIITTHPRLAEKQLTLITDIASDLPIIHGSISELLLCFTKVMDNALQYAKEGGTINLQATIVGNEALIRIQDDGAGIAPHDLPRIFERFFRADNARSTETGGAGLGLSIAQKIIELHGGRILAESQLGIGTTISIYLPAH